ncbi:hypothetical protein EN829_044785, partial [Mesorhizobium sp. M00.F.Ca.ET.186.01.1.1]
MSLFASIPRLAEPQTALFSDRFTAKTTRLEVVKTGQIGSFGSLIFEVTHEKVRTFDELTRSATARWSKHERFGQKPRSEFLGPDLDSISFKMRFDAQYGVNPKSEM